MGRYITTTGTNSAVTRIIGTTYSAVVNDRIICTTGGFTITLPSSALEGDIIQITDVTGVFETLNVTVARNGLLIQGAADNLTLDVDGTVITLVYTGGTYGWVITGS